MTGRQIIHVVSAHAAGEVGDVIVGGVQTPPGATLWEKRSYIDKDKKLRDIVLNEPRGGVFRHVNLLVPPVNSQADAAFIIMEPEFTPPMSGSNTMCVATVLLETGLLEMQEQHNMIKLEVPGGLISVNAFCHKGRVESVSITNLPSFVDQLDAPLEVAGFGTISVDVAYGGDSFVIVDAEKLGFAITADEACELVDLGNKLTAAANEQLGFTHPQNPAWDHISFCQFASPVVHENGVATGRNTVVIQPGKLDRSPTGTGCSARLAVLHARGQIRENEPFVARSVIGSEFRCRISDLVTIGGKQAVVPEVTGRAWLTGTHQHWVEPDDPWPRGYRISDTWPGGAYSNPD